MAFYNAYIDESGDEGFTDVATPASGSSEWLILTGVLVPEEDDLALARAVEDLRALLNKPPPKPLHFRELKHGGRRAAMTKLATYPFVFCTVALWKPQITSAYLQKAPHLYNYACRFLVERLTWYANNNGRRLNLYFSNRASTSYADLQRYMTEIQNDPHCSIVRGCINGFQPVNVNVKLVQVADFYASASATALEPNVYGLGEESYLLAVKDQLYRGRGGVFSTGFKIFPDPGRDMARYPWLAQL